MGDPVIAPTACANSVHAGHLISPVSLRTIRINSRHTCAVHTFYALPIARNETGTMSFGCEKESNAILTSDRPGIKSEIQYLARIKGTSRD
jgi:hypothetical protein